MTGNRFQRGIIVHKEYFWDFYRSLNKSGQRKTEWTLGLVRDLPVIPEKYFKSIKGTKGLFEIRIQSGNDAYRVFCCFNDSRGVVLLNGFKKKSNRTPMKEIARAVKLKGEYYYERRDRF